MRMKVHLKQLNLLTPVQISNLLSYRKLLGNFLSIYELQAIPAWDLVIDKANKAVMLLSRKKQMF